MTEEQKKARPSYAYMPFGAVPRICIGNHFALMEAHLIVATIARRWRFRLAQHPDIVAKLSRIIDEQHTKSDAFPLRGVDGDVPPAAPKKKGAKKG